MSGKTHEPNGSAKKSGDKCEKRHTAPESIDDSIDGLIDDWCRSDEGTHRWDSATAWRNFQKLIGPERRKPAQSLRSPAPRIAIPRWRRNRTAQLASVLAVIAAVGILTKISMPYLDQPGPAVEASDAREVVTKKSQQARIELSDGSHVRLNVDSRLSIPSQFGTDAREVFLVGEAYFEVAPNDDLPFVLYTENASVHVVGTAFNVNAYDDADESLIVVIHGRVNVRPKRTVEPTEISIGRRQMAHLHANGDVSVRQNVLPDAHIGWLYGRLRFQDSPLNEVAKTLARRYDLDIHISPSEIASRRLTASFQNESISEILRVISESLDVTHTRNRNQVYITHRHTSAEV